MTPEAVLNQISEINFFEYSESVIAEINPNISITSSKNSPAGHHVHQTHSTLTVEAGVLTSKDTETRQEADGIFTNKKNELISIKTADCLPIILWKNGECAALHAGWRGLYSGIIENYFENRKASEYQAMLGPCIVPECLKKPLNI